MRQQYSSTKKAQVYTLDFLLAILIFTAVVVISLKLIFNTSEPNDYQMLQLEARAISDMLLSEGLPNDWDADNVGLPGILTNGKLSTNKLQELNILGYNNVSGLLNTRKQFYFYFKNATNIVNVSICGFGAINDTCEIPEIESNNLVRLDRITVYDNTAIKMVMLVWE